MARAINNATGTYHLSEKPLRAEKITALTSICGWSHNCFPLTQCTILAALTIIFLDLTIEEDLGLMVMPFRGIFCMPEAEMVILARGGRYLRHSWTFRYCIGCLR